MVVRAPSMAYLEFECHETGIVVRNDEHDAVVRHVVEAQAKTLGHGGDGLAVILLETLARLSHRSEFASQSTRTQGVVRTSMSQARTDSSTDDEYNARLYCVRPMMKPVWPLNVLDDAITVNARFAS